MERGEIRGTPLHKELLSSHGVLSTTFISALHWKYWQLWQGYVKPDNGKPGSLKGEHEGENFKARPISCCSLCGKRSRKGLKLEKKKKKPQTCMSKTVNSNSALLWQLQVSVVCKSRVRKLPNISHSHSVWGGANTTPSVQMVPEPLRHPQNHFCLPEWRRFWLIMIYCSQHSDNLVVSPVNQPKLSKENWEDQSLPLKKSSLLDLQARG